MSKFKLPNNWKKKFQDLDLSGSNKSHLTPDVTANYSCVESVNGCDDGTPPTANFTVSVDNTTFLATFTNTSSTGECATGGVTYSWTGYDLDATTELWTSSSQTPNAYIYTLEGDYNVELTVTTDCGTSTIIKQVTIDYERPVANFTFAFNVGVDPCDITFTDTSVTNCPTGGLNSHFWNFKDRETDESLFTSTDQNPSITSADLNNSCRNLRVELTVSDPCGTSTTVTKEILQDPVASITVDTTSTAQPILSATNSVAYDTDGLPNTYQWTFKDDADSTLLTLPASSGSTALSSNGLSGTYLSFTLNLQTFYTTFSYSGDVTIELVVTDAIAQSSQVASTTVTAVTVPVAAFTGTLTNDTYTVDTNTSVSGICATPGALSYSWRVLFNASPVATSTDTLPSFALTQNGDYTIELTATDACGSDIATEVVTLALNPVANQNAPDQATVLFPVLDPSPSISYDDDQLINDYRWLVLVDGTQITDTGFVNGTLSNSYLSGDASSPTLDLAEFYEDSLIGDAPSISTTFVFNVTTGILSSTSVAQANNCSNPTYTTKVYNEAGTLVQDLTTQSVSFTPSTTGVFTVIHTITTDCGFAATTAQTTVTELAGITIASVTSTTIDTTGTVGNDIRYRLDTGSDGTIDTIGVWQENDGALVLSTNTIASGDTIYVDSTDDNGTTFRTKSWSVPSSTVKILDNDNYNSVDIRVGGIFDPFTEQRNYAVAIKDSNDVTVSTQNFLQEEDSITLNLSLISAGIDEGDDFSIEVTAYDEIGNSLLSDTDDFSIGQSFTCLDAYVENFTVTDLNNGLYEFSFDTSEADDCSCDTVPTLETQLFTGLTLYDANSPLVTANLVWTGVDFAGFNTNFSISLDSGSTFSINDEQSIGTNARTFTAESANVQVRFEAISNLYPTCSVVFNPSFTTVTASTVDQTVAVTGNTPTAFDLSSGGSLCSSGTTLFEINNSPPDGTITNFNSATGTGTFSRDTGFTGDTVMNINCYCDGYLMDSSSITFDVSEALSAPTAPQSLATTAINSTSVSLSWSAPASDGGASITSYVVEYDTDGNGFTQNQNVGNNLTGTITGLTRATAYEFRVYAINSEGNGATSNELDVTTLAVIPGAIADLASPSNTSDSVSLTWSAPDNGGGTISNYTLEWDTDGGGFTNTVSLGNVLSYTLNALTFNTAYEFRIYATNEIGDGPSSNEVDVTTAATIPTAVSDLGTTAIASTTLDLSWSTPANNGSAITGYTLQWDTNGSGFTNSVALGAVNTYQLTGLTPNTQYELRIIATNSIGNSTSSNVITPTTSAAAPSAITDLAFTNVAADQLELTWTAPANNGSAITNYTVEYDTNGSGFTQSVSAGSTPGHTLTGLSASTQYEIRVTATNAVGTSTASNVVNPTTLAGSLSWLMLVDDNTSIVAHEAQLRDDIIALGDTVQVENDTYSQTAANLTGFDVIFIAESTATGNLDDTNLTDSTAFVVLGNRSYADDIQLASAGGGNAGDDKVTVETSAYPTLTASYTATTLVDFNDGGNMRLGFVNNSGISSGGVSVATLENNNTRSAIVYWPSGSDLLTGTAAGPRLFWGIISDDVYGNRTEHQEFVDGMIQFVQETLA